MLSHGLSVALMDFSRVGPKKALLVHGRVVVDSQQCQYDEHQHSQFVSMISSLINLQPGRTYRALVATVDL